MECLSIPLCYHFSVRLPIKQSGAFLCDKPYGDSGRGVLAFLRTLASDGQRSTSDYVARCLSQESRKGETLMKKVQKVFAEPYVFRLPALYPLREKNLKSTLTTEYPFIRYIPCTGARAPAKAAGPP